MKGGVRPLGRMSPSPGGKDARLGTPVAFGGRAAGIASGVASRQSDIEQGPGFTTPKAFGTLVMFFGVGTPVTFEDAVAILLVHGFDQAASPADRDSRSRPRHA